MLEIDALHKRFGRTTAIDGLSLRVPHGQMLAVIGPSGAGKSTLLRTLNRLCEPSAGHIRYNGRDIVRLKGRQLHRWRNRCAMIFQQFNLVNRLDVLSNVLVGRVARRSTLRSVLKLFTREERALAVLTLEHVGMATHILQRADTLSGGQQQRVAIARALVQQPEIILADEPVASLDPHNAEVVMRTLREINRHHGITMIVNVHVLDTARRFCDRVVGMNGGRLVFDGCPDELDAAAYRTIYGAGSTGDAPLAPAPAHPAPVACAPAGIAAAVGGATTFVH